MDNRLFPVETVSLAECHTRTSYSGRENHLLCKHLIGQDPFQGHLEYVRFWSGSTVLTVMRSGSVGWITLSPCHHRGEGVVEAACSASACGRRPPYFRRQVQRFCDSFWMARTAMHVHCSFYCHLYLGLMLI